MNMKPYLMARYWINQPSTIQPDHAFHGQTVIAPRNLNDFEGDTVTVYFARGDIHSVIVFKRSLSLFL